MATSLIPIHNLPIKAISADVSVTVGAGKSALIQFPFPADLKNNWYAIAWYKGGASDATGRNSIMVCPAAFTATLGNTNFIAYNTTQSDWSGTVQIGYLLVPKSKVDYSWQTVS